MPSRDRECRCRPCSNPRGICESAPGWCRVRDRRTCRENCFRRCCVAAGSNSSLACLPDRPVSPASRSGACDAEWAPCCRRISNRPATACIDSKSFRSEEHTSELQSHHDLVCRLLLEKKKKK